MLSSLLYLIQPENKINSQSIQNTMFGQYREIRLDTYKHIFHKVLMNYDTKIILPEWLVSSENVSDIDFVEKKRLGIEK